MLTLNYLTFSGEVVESKVNPEMTGFDHWLQALVDMNPEVNLFFTTKTTDIALDSTWKDA